MVDNQRPARAQGKRAHINLDAALSASKSLPSKHCKMDQQAQREGAAGERAGRAIEVQGEEAGVND